MNYCQTWSVGEIRCQECSPQYQIEELELPVSKIGVDCLLCSEKNEHAVIVVVVIMEHNWTMELLHK